MSSESQTWSVGPRTAPPAKSRGAGMIPFLLALAPSLMSAQGHPHAAQPSVDSRWAVVRLDVDVWLRPTRGTMATRGTATLRLDGGPSYGPDLLINTRLTAVGEPALRFESVEVRGATVTLEDSLFGGAMHQASIRYARPLPSGTTIEVHFACRATGPVRRMVVQDQAAMADWSNAWLPFPRPPSGRISMTPELLRAPGRTTLHLPPGWTGVVDGRLSARSRSASGTTEEWRTPEGVTRSFVAGPFRATTEVDGPQQVVVYTLSDSSHRIAATVARRTLAAIAALRQRFGAAPFPATYSVIEFPRLPQQSFGAVSEQTFIVVQPPNFEYAEANIQLIAHEVAHAWWGNAVGIGGPGSVFLSEALAEYGAVLVIEAVDGPGASARFLDFAPIGTDPYYSAAGYFTLLRQGQDQPLASLGSGAGSWALANSKGVWIFHMLREAVSDSLFFATLRRIAADFRGRSLTVDSLRTRFLQAAPGVDLAGFFAQWLDRWGAPVLDVDWHANGDGSRVLIRVSQRQPGPPFRLKLPFTVALGNGSQVAVTLALDSSSQTFELPVQARPAAVTLDPDHRLLLWHPPYGPPPAGEIIGASLRPTRQIVDAVVGEYRFVDFDKPVRVFARDGVLYVQPAGSVALRLIPESPGVFRVDGPGESWIEFDLSRSPAPQLVSVEAGGRERYVARRSPSEGS